MSPWRDAEAGDLQRVVASLRRREWAYVPFSARLCHAGWQRLWQRRAWSVLLEQSDAEPVSALLITRSGLVLPALRDGRPLPRELRPLMQSYGRSIHSVMGTHNDVIRVQELLGRGHTVVDYTLMTVAGDTYRYPVMPEELQIQRGRPRDARRLFELQRAYELEEVMIYPARFDRDECLRLLRRSLHHELVYFGTIDGHPVTKAGTNARGFAVDQIGGVYTELERRRRGYGSAVMTALLEELFAADKQATLFVKLDNAAAIRMYGRLGFVQRDRYRICYYPG